MVWLAPPGISIPGEVVEEQKQLQQCVKNTGNLIQQHSPDKYHERQTGRLMEEEKEPETTSENGANTEDMDNQQQQQQLDKPLENDD